MAGIDFNQCPPQRRKPERRENPPLWQVMREAGYDLGGEAILDGAIRRFATADDRHGGKAGWYMGDANPFPSAIFGDWRTGEKYYWSAYEYSSLDEEERAAVDAARARQKAVVEAEDKEKHEKCLRKARAMLAECPEPFTHPYLERKGVFGHGIKVAPDGMLVLPINDINGNLHGLYRLWDNGEKKPLFGSHVGGHFYKIEGGGNVYCITEGFATAASIHEATGWTTYAAWNCGNLGKVAAVLKKALPGCIGIICGDDDVYREGENPGREHAERAARETGLGVVFPRFSSLAGQPTDFNDLAVREGKEAVREQLEVALAAMRKPRWSGF